MTSYKFRLPLCSIGLLLGSEVLQADDWSYKLRAGIAELPRYSGSNQRVTAPVFGAGVQSPYGFFVDTDKGVGWKNNGRAFNFSTYVGASTDRRDRNSTYKGSNHLRGLGTIHARPQIGATAAFILGSNTFAAALEHALEKNSQPDTGSSYSKLDLSVTNHFYDGAFGQVNLGFGAQFGDSDYVRTWYSVSQVQSARSGLSPYNTRGGFVSSNFSLGWSLPTFDRTLTFSTLLDVRFLGSDVGSSPVVQQRVQQSLTGQIVYAF